MENYYNYYTEIEEHFWKKRGTTLLLSSLDWALIETWKEAEIPMEAVLKGIDRAFEKHDSRRRRWRKVNSLAYCHQAVLEAAQERQRTALHYNSGKEAIPRAAMADFFSNNAAALEQAGLRFAEQGRAESAATLRALAASLGELAAAARSDVPLDLEETERRLTVLEEKMLSTLWQAAEEAALVAIRAEMDRELAPVRRNLRAEQIALIEKQFLHRKLLEAWHLPRLSLFYL